MVARRKKDDDGDKKVSPSERVELAVYDDKLHVGNLVDLGCGVVAELVDGTSIGRFASRPAAMHYSCRECGEPFQAKRRAEFCSLPCRRQFHSRRRERGAMLYDVAMAWRLDRQSARRSLNLLCRMVSRFAEEDQRDRSGRSSWDDPITITRRHPHFAGAIVNRNAAGARR